jgi:hypothetical protein
MFACEGRLATIKVQRYEKRLKKGVADVKNIINMQKLFLSTHPYSFFICNFAGSYEEISIVFSGFHDAQRQCRTGERFR